MSKKDISKSIVRGAVKQRALLVLEEKARSKRGLPPLFTQVEVDKLLDSFRSPYEIRVYNEMIDIERRQFSFITNLQTFSFEVSRNVMELRGYLLLIASLEGAEDLANIILSEIKDLKERKRLAELGNKKVHFLFTLSNTDEEGFINIDTAKSRRESKLSERELKRIKDSGETGSNIKQILDRVITDIIDSVKRYNTYRQAYLDYVEETGVEIKQYLKELEIYSKRAWKSPLFDKDTYNILGIDPDKEPGIQRAKRLKPLYSIVPDLEEMEIDPVEYKIAWEEIHK